MNAHVVTTLAAVALVAACGGKAPRPVLGNTTVGSGGHGAAEDPLVSAATLEIHDQWVGLGCTHSFTATLHAHGLTFDGDAELTAGSPSETTTTRAISVPRAVIAALEEAAEQARAAPPPPPSTRPFVVLRWTDDYPVSTMTFTGPAGVHRIGFADQQRRLTWEHGDQTVALDRSHDWSGREHSKIWDAYQAVLGATGLPTWRDEICRASP